MQDSQNIKNLILDFGGVIYDISHQKQQDAFEALGYKGFNKVYSQARQNPLFADLECGRISDKDFRAAAKTFLGLDIADQQLDKLWNSILIGFVPERIELLKHLQKNYRLFLLSNTNSIHFQVYMREFKDRFSRKHFGRFRSACASPTLKSSIWYSKVVILKLRNPCLSTTQALILKQPLRWECRHTYLLPLRNFLIFSTTATSFVAVRIIIQILPLFVQIPHATDRRPCSTNC